MTNIKKRRLLGKYSCGGRNRTNQVSLSKPTAICLFAGCGGDTLGLINAGFDVIGFVEFWGPAVQTYVKNFPWIKFIGEKYEGDMTRIPDNEFLEFRGKVDLISAGFPCEGFSHAGKKDPNDPRNRLFWEFVRATDLIRPGWIVGENVFGLAHRKTDNGKATVAEVITSAFEEIGYRMTRRILNAADYGIPQKRRRVLFVGSRGGMEFDFPPPTHRRGEYTTIRDIVEFSLEGAVQFDQEKVHGGVKSFCEGRSNEEPRGKPHPYLQLKLGKGLVSYAKRISPFHVEVVDLDAPAKTIHSGYSFQPRLFVPLRKKDGDCFLRTFTTSELAQIQGFPKNFKFCGRKEEIIEQIGDAVPPKLMEVIAKQIVSLDPSLSSPRTNGPNYGGVAR